MSHGPPSTLRVRGSTGWGFEEFDRPGFRVQNLVLLGGSGE